MRSLWGVVASVCLGLLLSACDTTDTRYFRYGIGTDLYSEDIVATTQYQDIYLTELCRQTLSLTSTTEGQCVNVQLSPNDWNLLVQAGLNDVDRRCDSYLAWLDDRRRTNTAVLKELGDLTVASQAIMRVAGVSANPITLAGLAFGLAADTFINVNSRLLLEVDKTTVQTLVLQRRNNYRVGLQSVRVENRPAAVYALRSYLNICTPFTIETDINSTVTVFQMGGSAALNRPPLIDPTIVSGMTIQRSRDTVQKTQFTDEQKKKVTQATVTDIQLALCVPVRDGIPSDATIEAVRQYLVAQKRPVPKEIDLTSNDLRQVLQAPVNDVGDCKKAKFKNGFEVGRYGVPAQGHEARIKVLQRKMGLLLAAKKSPLKVEQTGIFDDDTRKAIQEIRRLTADPPPAADATFSDQLDSKLNTLIQASS